MPINTEGIELIRMVEVAGLLPGRRGGRIGRMKLTKPQNLRIDLPLEAIAEICGRFGVSELAIFGSSLRDDFRPDSDVDFLVRFIDNDAGPWMKKFMDMEEELARLLGRKVDIADWNGVIQSTNPYRRNHILKHHQIVYVA